MGAKITHYALYGFMVVMPVTGITMGYFGGKGLPFFYTALPGGEKNGAVAGQAFKIHKLAGTYGKYLIPLHVGAAGQHAVRGHSIFYRVNPFR
jgi:1,2-dihydroxy-3-keto-5-methylthiopentene dioxygenase